MLQEFTFLVPQVGNDNVPFPAEYFTALEATLLEDFQGWTKGAAEYGQWRDPADGKVYTGYFYPYKVAVPLTQVHFAISSLAFYIGEKFKQYAVYVSGPVPVTVYGCYPEGHPINLPPVHDDR